MSEIKGLINVAHSLVVAAKEVQCKQDKDYVKNSKLLEFHNSLPEVTPLGKRNNRATILQAIEEWVTAQDTNDESAIEQEVTKEETVPEQEKEDTEEEKNEELVLPFNKKTCWVILTDILEKSSKNNYINFASYEMIRFVITWRFFHKTCKVKGVDENGKEVKIDNPAVTQQEKEAVNEFISKLVNHYGFLLNEKGTGYTIPCFLMAWHHRKVVYKFAPKKSGSNHYYELDYNSQKITHTDVNGNVISVAELTKDICKKIDNSCKFLRVVLGETQE